jgi:hypothetical protein
MNYWIETYTGKQFSFTDPQEDQIYIEDIAHALSNLCRYSGHCNRFYSVAEHSVAVSELLAGDLAGLLHDASEAYVVDIPSPLKPLITNYKTIEDRIMKVIATKYKFKYPCSQEVKYADVVQLSTEARHLLPSKGNDWNWKYFTGGERPIRYGIIPRCLAPQKAEQLFLDKYKEITANDH